MFKPTARQALYPVMLWLSLPVSAQVECDLPEPLCAADQAYAKADKELNDTYKEITKRIERDAYKDFLVEKSQILESLKQSQRAWIKFRDSDCNAYYILYSGGTSRNLDLIQCETATTQGRTAKLRKVYLEE